MATCNECRWRHLAIGGMVECRRHAPVWRDAKPQHPYGDMPQFAFPRMNAWDSCGDFEPSPVSEI